LKIKSVNSIFLKDLMTHPHSVSSCDPFGIIIPQEHMVIVIIKFIEINRLVGSFSNLAECDLPQASNLFQNIRNDLLFSQEYFVVFAFQQPFIQVTAGLYLSLDKIMRGFPGYTFWLRFGKFKPFWDIINKTLSFKRICQHICLSSQECGKGFKIGMC